MIDFPDELEECKTQFLHIVHASLPADVSCLFSCEPGTHHRHLKKKLAEGDPDQLDFRSLVCSSLVSYSIDHHMALCSGHALVKTRTKDEDTPAWVPSSTILLPVPAGERGCDLYCFYRFREDSYHESELYFVRNMLKRFQMYLDHCRTLRKGTEDFESSGARESGIIQYYLSNLLSAFIQASSRILPIKVFIFTLWTDIVTKGEYLQVTGYSRELLGGTAYLENSQFLVRHPGITFRIHDFHFFYRKINRRSDLDDTTPELPIAASVRLYLEGKVVGTITCKMTETEDQERMKQILSTLTSLIVWEMQIERKRNDLTKRIRGDHVTIINTKSFQDELINHYRFARRYGESLSAIIFKPNNPFRVTCLSEESFSRLFLLMRKSIRAIDSACFYGLNGFLILLPRAKHHDAMDIAERLMRLAAEVAKHDRYLGRRNLLEYRVVSFPESAKNEVELWEAITDAVPT